MARGTPQAGLRGLGLAGLCEFGTVGQQRRPRWIFCEPAETGGVGGVGSALSSVRRRRRRRGRKRGRKPRPTTEEEEGRGFLRWGVAPLWVKEEEEKGRAPRPHGFCKPTGCLNLPFWHKREMIEECPMTEMTDEYAGWYSSPKGEEKGGKDAKAKANLPLEIRPRAGVR